ncbi:hypothetical protein WDA38_18230 [Acinetobacter pittii]|uniref:hypothetical protein n=2 Tax=Acinetobacter TaxID=469 RepID=UPI0006684032|nr:hypothetical protein [Acinetobacter pittii]OIF97471.1 hypothetical protein A7N09_19905 [Acinetobacter baumannii]DAH98631.1 MAG TPA: Protein of unknown function (DUF2570) [Caudoviricetes sp.]MDQ9813469.1 hypothetical protein [Acinetobacter pittii]MDX8271413.1 hypothetical protein [Acinetobacter pittii]OTT42102.1 hypothetical protein CAS79_06145 [Acinetobacter pittii]
MKILKVILVLQFVLLFILIGFLYSMNKRIDILESEINTEPEPIQATISEDEIETLKNKVYENSKKIESLNSDQESLREDHDHLQRYLCQVNNICV